MNNIKDRLKGSLYGFAIGDAMGATTEFMSEDEIKSEYGKLTDIVGGGWLDLMAGEVTDDTQMSICVMEVLMKNDFKNFKKDVADSFVDWYDTNPKDIGNQCRKAIAFYDETGNYISEDNTALGNGSLMRAMPCALLNSEKSVELNFIQGDITHNNDICRNILKEYTEIIKAHILGKNLDLEKRELLKPSGYVINTFNNAIYWSESETFEDCIIGAVNHGGDADTIAGIAGSIAGAKFGFDNIPKRWVESLDKEVVKKLEEFLEYISKTYGGSLDVRGND